MKRCNRAPVCLCILSSKHHDQKQKCHKAYSWERKQQEQILLMAKKLHETSSRQPAAVDWWPYQCCADPLSNLCSLIMVLGGQAAGTWADLCRTASPGPTVDSFWERWIRAGQICSTSLLSKGELIFLGSRSEGVCWLCVELCVITLLLLQGRRVWPHNHFSPGWESLPKQLLPFNFGSSCAQISCRLSKSHAGYKTTTTSVVVLYTAVPHSSAPFWPHSP